jgi:anthranilate phosphoribosyltransferase
VLQDEPSAFRDAAVMTAGAALLMTGKSKSFREGVVQAQEAIGSGAALKAMETLVKVSNG